ncbi:hypothetical protein ACIQXI_20215 [Lysinibacillus sp. NPDC097195]|uniref:hypothetical protein n=1 Tax=Lysinibacillus sp. NPDC097195 TaxID=3364141 RepID=UPI003827C723
MESKKTYKLFTIVFALACILLIFFITKNGAAPVAVLSQQEKEELYQQYLEILEEVKATVTWGDGLEGIEVAPIDSFEEEDWVTPEVFKQRAIDRVQASVVDEEDWFSLEALKLRVIDMMEKIGFS